MRFAETGIPGAWIVEPERLADSRGWFTRTWCSREFAARGIPAAFPQGNESFNRSRGTLRGLHFQRSPSREGKLVRCTTGEIYDVVVDLRPRSPAFLRHFGMVLSPANGVALYIPPGCAHGFMTLSDDSTVIYAMGDSYDAALAGGARWNDTAFGIRWPMHQPSVISERDRDYPDFDRGSWSEFSSLGND
ncbi:MAG: dTDP-4-dehydrorhamnose 3,5-epimerase [Gammaproteobacteria bacterium]|nr:dTDP-4-dehydrorhamnose 3,5-epimerase [Gammaproteobacteria bacterium]